LFFAGAYLGPSWTWPGTAMRLNFGVQSQAFVGAPSSGAPTGFGLNLFPLLVVWLLWRRREAARPDAAADGGGSPAVTRGLAPIEPSSTVTHQSIWLDRTRSAADPRLAELARVLDALAAHLARHGVVAWSERMATYAGRVREHGPASLHRLLGEFGGAGSFSDLRIDPLNGHRVAPEDVDGANLELQRLQDEVRALATSIRTGPADAGRDQSIQ
jgi:hypothetical protein